MYIVSRNTALAVKDRDDILLVAGLIYDDNKRIIGCTGFEKG